jgi:hypothetical protein
MHKFETWRQVLGIGEADMAGSWDALVLHNSLASRLVGGWQTK